MHSEHDPIGAASARLLGAGVPRSDRLFALRVLGLLLDHADRDGVVRVLPATLAGEFDLDRAKVETAFLQLRGVGTLVPAPAGWLIDGYEDYAPGEVNAGTALALIADLLEGPLAEPSVPRAPAPGIASRAYPVLTGVMVVLLLVVAATTGRDGDPQVALRVAGIDHDDVPDAPDEDPDDAAPSPSTSTSGSTPQEQQRPSSVPDRPGAPRPASAPTTVVEPTAPTPAGPAPCPAGAPELEIVEVRALPLPSSDRADASSSVPVGGPGWHVTVQGTLANPAAAPLVVDAFDVVVQTADEEQVVEGLSEPVTLAPGTSHAWEVTTATSLTAPPPDAEDVTAVVRVWRWTETCGSGGAG